MNDLDGANGDFALLNFFKEQYYFELERRDSLNKSLGLPFAMLTALAGSATYLLEELPRGFHESPIRHELLFGSVMVLAACAYCLVRAWWNHQYEHIPLAQQISSFEDQLREYSRCDSEDSFSAKRYFWSDVRARLVSAATTNALSNERKSGYIHLGIKFLWIGAALLFLCAIAHHCSSDMPDRTISQVVNRGNKFVTTPPEDGK